MHGGMVNLPKNQGFVGKHYEKVQTFARPWKASLSESHNFSNLSYYVMLLKAENDGSMTTNDACMMPGM
jgi:hypothetical protein